MTFSLKSPWAFITGATEPTPRPVPVPRRMRPRPKVRREYPDVLGKTACDILGALAQDNMNAKWLKAVTGATTVGIHLPRLVERGLVQVVDNRRPFIYAITDKGRARLAGGTEFGA